MEFPPISLTAGGWLGRHLDPLAAKAAEQMQQGLNPPPLDIRTQAIVDEILKGTVHSAEGPSVSLLSVVGEGSELVGVGVGGGGPGVQVLVPQEIGEQLGAAGFSLSGLVTVASKALLPFFLLSLCRRKNKEKVLRVVNLSIPTPEGAEAYRVTLKNGQIDGPGLAFRISTRTGLRLIEDGNKDSLPLGSSQPLYESSHRELHTLCNIFLIGVRTLGLPGAAEIYSLSFPELQLDVNFVAGSMENFSNRAQQDNIRAENLESEWVDPELGVVAFDESLRVGEERLISLPFKDGDVGLNVSRIEIP